VKNLENEKNQSVLDGFNLMAHSLGVKTWIKIVVEDGVDIFQLAIKYYGDRNKYKQIYLANKDIIGDNLQLTDGMSLKIPIIEPFKEQPMFINMD
jgi:hypothetical protein